MFVYAFLMQVSYTLVFHLIYHHFYVWSTVSQLFSENGVWSIGIQLVQVKWWYIYVAITIHNDNPQNILETNALITAY